MTLGMGGSLWMTGKEEAGLLFWITEADSPGKEAR